MDKKLPFPIIIYDDREMVSPVLEGYVGSRSYGSIHVRNSNLSSRFLRALPEWAQDRVVNLTPSSISTPLHDILEQFSAVSGVLFISAYGAVENMTRLEAILERVPYSKESFVDDPEEPLLAFINSVQVAAQNWDKFIARGLSGLIDSLEIEPLIDFDATVDIRRLPALLKFLSGATESRSFNQTEFDEFVFTKRSSDKEKIKAEHNYFSLIPNQMKSWMVGSYGYAETDEHAEYRMRRYMYADASFQWVHRSWSSGVFDEFLDQVLFYLSSRPIRSVEKYRAEETTLHLFKDKVHRRLGELQSSEDGKRLIETIKAGEGGAALFGVFEDYFSLIEKHWERLCPTELVIGHGDACLSNILYDPPTRTLKFIDPKGALTERDLWTHPLYDYCKLSHSILGGYDFINNHLFRVALDERAALHLQFQRHAPKHFQTRFQDRLSKIVDISLLRLCEASLFLSMLPLHMDYPNKVVAFMLRAREILDEII